MKHQSDLFGQVDTGLPEGLVYRPDFLRMEEEAALIERVAASSSMRRKSGRSTSPSGNPVSTCPNRSL